MNRGCVCAGKRGSTTVEASLIMPLVLLCVVFVLYVGFYWYDCAVCTGACYNAARLLAAEDAQFSFSDERKLLRQRSIALTNLYMTQEQNGSSVTVAVTGEVRIPLFGGRLKLKTSQTSYILEQHAFLNRCRLLEELIRQEE